MPFWKQPHLRGVALLCALVTAAVLVLHARLAAYRVFEMQMHDQLIRYIGRSRVDPRLVYLALDETTMNVSGTVFADDLAASPELQKMAAGWPWSREVHARVIQKLMQAGAREVVLDILFPSAREGDAALRRVLDEYRDHVVIGSNFSDADAAGASRMLTVPADDLIPEPKLDGRVGYVNFWPDVDGVVRNTKYRLSEAEAFGVNGTGPTYYSLGARVLQQLGLGGSVPGARRALRFAPPAEQGGFQPIPLYMIFLPKAWKENFQNGAFFQGKIVMVGPYGNSLKDQLLTPFGMMDGPELHLNAINDALRGDFISTSSELELVGLVFFMGFAAFVAGALLNRPLNLAMAIGGVTILYLAGTVVAFDFLHRALPFFSPLLVFDGSSVLALYWRWLLERRERSRMRRMFERFVSRNVVKEVVENRKSFLHQIGGVRKNVAIMMTDLRGFTALTEEADSTQLVAQLNEYFSEMVKCVFANRGTLDKFVGDAILAVWGNIHSGGAASDAELAVRTALSMLKSLEELNAEWPRRGWPVLKMGVGINFGEVIFGVIGSEEKAEPTVIGDAVNSASRLEGLTKEYGVDLLVGETVAELVRATFHLQLVDYVRVKGKTRAIKVYAVLGEKPAALPPPVLAYLRAYEQGLACYTAGEFREACSLFREALLIKPEDGLATVYLKRCERMGECAPEAWDGVFVMHSK